MLADGAKKPFGGTAVPSRGLGDHFGDGLIAPLQIIAQRVGQEYGVADKRFCDWKFKKLRFTADKISIITGFTMRREMPSPILSGL